ncbi:hypothetical protein M3O96_10920 [Aquiflexum sp. TKW24L]|uniref:hypothetical protein n=1 Tax=Aquiflexum sp. TKW24L TaxID=2942212 RepID=UPI0020BE7DC7|nr:hypothetical protein [Aquiflexum sp. TKW24L]MCL6259605.1 hypothetical protein [Aquiflexum sp. TKW24L]
MRLFLVLFLSISFGFPAFSQMQKSNRSTMYMTYGRTGANLREFNQMLAERGLSPMRSSYSNLSFGYVTRFNDFIIGLELFQNSGPKSNFDGYEIDYQSTRFYVNVGFAFTEEGNFQLIHYMSVGTGFLNFQMLKENPATNLEEFFQNPAHGFILRDGNLHKGTLNMTGFLTEIGFQMSYDVPIPGREEAIELLARFGYSFSPFEDSWKLNGIRFNSTQSGAFIRLGAGVTIPDHNFFYKDAAIGAHLIYGFHFTQPDEFNSVLEQNGLAPFKGRPNNIGLKVLGESKGFLYGIDIYNLGLSGQANESKSHTLNSLRVYGNAGLKFFERKNLEFGGTGGIGYANIRYSLLENNKPDFPRLFEEPLHDAFLRKGGLIAKPEVYVAYGIPLSPNHSSKLMIGINGGYELPLANFKLLDLSMAGYMSNPYFQLSVGIRH